MAPALPAGADLPPTSLARIVVPVGAPAARLRCGQRRRRSLRHRRRAKRRGGQRPSHDRLTAAHLRARPWNSHSGGHAGTRFVEKYIFPNAVSPSLAQLGRATEGLLVVEDLQNIGPDYEPTLLAWWENFDRAYPELKHRYDERFYRMWWFYLLAAARAARARDAQVFQLVLIKSGRRQPDCRMS